MTTAIDCDLLLLDAIRQDPKDDTAWYALADALEEQDDPRAEQTRLSVFLRRQLDHPAHPEWESCTRELLAAGVRVALPRMTLYLEGGIPLEMVQVPPGEFWMGSPENEPGRQESERRHRVRHTKPYWIGVHQVTQAQWRAVMGTDPSHFKGETRPVERVSWDDCQVFLGKLNEQMKGCGITFCLPTEAQWEYACRAGTTTAFAFGDTLTTDQANYDGNYPPEGTPKGISRGETTPVGSFPANAWGLYDMHGNVWEWCQDFFGPYPEPSAEQQSSGAGDTDTTDETPDPQKIAADATNGSGMTPMASGSAEGENSLPFEFSGAAETVQPSGVGDTVTRETTPDHRRGTNGTKETGTNTSASGSAEGENSRPFASNGEEVGSATDGAEDPPNSSVVLFAEDLPATVASVSSEDEQRDPFGFSAEGAGQHGCKMSGQPGEWITGRIQADATMASASQVVDPVGPETGTRRIRRGGSYGMFGSSCQSDFRNEDPPWDRHQVIGFRLSASESV